MAFQPPTTGSNFRGRGGKVAVPCLGFYLCNLLAGNPGGCPKSWVHNMIPVVYHFGELVHFTRFHFADFFSLRRSRFSHIQVPHRGLRNAHLRNRLRGFCLGLGTFGNNPFLGRCGCFVYHDYRIAGFEQHNSSGPRNQKCDKNEYNWNDFPLLAPYRVTKIADFLMHISIVSQKPIKNAKISCEKCFYPICLELICGSKSPYRGKIYTHLCGKQGMLLDFPNLLKSLRFNVLEETPIQNFMFTPKQKTGAPGSTFT